MPRNKADNRKACQVNFDFHGGHYFGPATMIEKCTEDEFIVEFPWQGKRRKIAIYRDEITEWPKDMP